MAKERRRMPNHGEWMVEDQTATGNGYKLLRYCGALPYLGWHSFGHHESREAAIKAQVGYENPDRYSNGEPWPDEPTPSRTVEGWDADGNIIYADEAAGVAVTHGDDTPDNPLSDKWEGISRT